jgi:hypothetical protein
MKRQVARETLATTKHCPSQASQEKQWSFLSRRRIRIWIARCKKVFEVAEESAKKTI